MKILTIDIGTGTQDIFLYDSRLNIENGFKLVLPSPTMIIHRSILEATRLRQPILLTGVMMGGGPSAWAVEAHLKSGLPVFATPAAAKTINDELEKVEKLGVKVVSEEEAARLVNSTTLLELRDLDLPAIWSVFNRFGVPLNDLSAVAVAVFDHGNAPPGVSDRQFRFDYLDERIRNWTSTKRHYPLSVFAYSREDIPAIMTRLKAVAASAERLDCPLIVMDTAPAAILGASFDPAVKIMKQKIIANVGNFHTLAFRLGEEIDRRGPRIEGLFEHHTGEIDLPKLESLLRRLADGSLKHQDVFDDMGHGALIYETSPLLLCQEAFDVVVSGPRRSMFNAKQSSGSLRPYFAAPFGDMMLSGNIGLLAATADVLPDLAGSIHASLEGDGGSGAAPWDI
jgi:uncharacterized protein (DUF1786 family)